MIICSLMISCGTFANTRLSTTGCFGGAGGLGITSVTPLEEAERFFPFDERRRNIRLRLRTLLLLLTRLSFLLLRDDCFSIFSLFYCTGPKVFKRTTKVPYGIFSRHTLPNSSFVDSTPSRTRPYFSFVDVVVIVQMMKSAIHGL